MPNNIQHCLCFSTKPTEIVRECESWSFFPHLTKIGVDHIIKHATTDKVISCSAQILTRRKGGLDSRVKSFRRIEGVSIIYPISCFLIEELVDARDVEVGESRCFAVVPLTDSILI